MRPAARESRPGKLLGEAGRSTGSQVQAGRSTQIQNTNTNTKYKIQTQIPNTVVNYLVIQDNEFELVFVLGYQKMLALAYLDKVKKCNLNSDFFIFGQKSHNNHFSCWTRFSLDFETCSWTPWKLAMSFGIFLALELTSPRYAPSVKLFIIGHC